MSPLNKKITKAANIPNRDNNTTIPNKFGTPKAPKGVIEPSKVYPCGHMLHRYQIEGANFLISKGHCLLADEMGLGKTAQTIVALDSVLALRVLIICPAIAKHNWELEFKMWSEIPRIVSIKQALKDPIGDKASGETVICTFDYAASNYVELAAQDFDAVIVDEAHFLKNIKAKRTRAILGVKGIAHNSKRLWLLTGTPAPNHAGEMWVYLYTFGATELSHETFVTKFCHTQVRRYPGAPPTLKVLGSRTETMGELKELIKKVTLRRLKRDVMKDLPPIHYENIDLEVEPLTHDFLCDLRGFARWYYPDQREDLEECIAKEDKLLSDVWTNLEGCNETEALQAISAMSGSISSLRRYVGIQKAKAIVPEIISFLNDNPKERLVVFGIHKDVIDYIHEKCVKKFGAKKIYGATTDRWRRKAMEDFTSDEGPCRLLVCNITSAGTAISLTAANRIWFVEMDWVPGNNAQAVMRLHRIGQMRPVHVRIYSNGEHLDAQIQKVLRRKTHDLTNIFD